MLLILMRVKFFWINILYLENSEQKFLRNIYLKVQSQNLEKKIFSQYKQKSTLFNLLSLDVPKLHLKLGANMNPDDIEDGDDVFFICHVEANPGAYKIIWRYNVSISSCGMKFFSRYNSSWNWNRIISASLYALVTEHVSPK